MLVIPPRGEVRAHPIQTERLLLLPVDAADGPDLWHAVDASRQSLQRWLPWVQFHTDAASSTRFAEACAQDWDQGRALRFIIRERATRKLLGIVGLEACVHMHRGTELGYWLRRDAEHRGLMTEAARATVDFAFRHMGANRVRVAAATDNHPSLRVIGRLGFKFEGIARQAEWCDGRWLDHAVFALVASDLAPPR
jgi:ribosomal-protein-serine acetyltransferase